MSIRSFCLLSSMVKKTPDHHCCRNKKQKWILKSRGREKIKMQYAQMCLSLGIWLKITFFHNVFITATICTKYGVEE